MRTRTILIIIIMLVLVGGGLYYWLTSKQSEKIDDAPSAVGYLPVTEDFPVSTSTAETPSDAERTSIRLVLDTAVAGYWLDESDRTLYALDDIGQILMLPYQGSQEIVYEGDGKTLLGVWPSLNGDMAIIATGSKAAPTFAVINVITRKRVFLPALTQSATWHPNGKDVVFLREEDAKNPAGVYVYTVSRGTSTLLARLTMAGVKLGPYSSSAISMIEEPSLQRPSRAWSFDLGRKTLRQLAPATAGLMASWSGSTEPLHMLAFAPAIGLAQIANGKITAFTDNIQTLPIKCALTSGLAYCAIPNAVPAKLPDSYLQKAVYTIDSFVTLTKEGVSSTLFNSQAEGQPVDAVSLQKIGDSLYFINRYDNKLYSLGPIE